MEKDMDADAILAGKTEVQLREAVSRARGRLALLESMEGIDPDADAWDGPFPPSKAFERWANSFGDRERHLLKMGIEDCLKELARRGAPA
jgi:hypothetical protein